jgi:predicted ester cyclase
MADHPEDRTDRDVPAAARWFTDGWAGAIDLADDLFSEELQTNGVAVGIAGPKRNIVNRLTGFPDLETEVEEIIAAGDRVIVRVRWRGTHTGPYSDVQPTGKPVDVRTIAIWRFRAGRVIEIWILQDQFSLLQQVGLIPAALYAAQVPAGA